MRNVLLMQCLTGGGSNQYCRNVDLQIFYCSLTKCLTSSGSNENGRNFTIQMSYTCSVLQMVAATNIAKTSVTLEGVVYVIDSLFASEAGNQNSVRHTHANIEILSVLRLQSFI